MSSDTTARIPISHIVRVLSPELSESILVRIQTDDRKTFSAFMAAVCATLKFRPNIWQTWPKQKQREWLWSNLRLPRFADTGRHLMQDWFFNKRVPMLNSFLDVLGIARDEEGHITGNVPDALDSAKIREGVDALLKEYPTEEVALYMYLFQGGKKGGWAALDAEILRIAPAAWQLTPTPTDASPPAP